MNPPAEAHWTLSCGHDIPRLEREGSDERPHRCPLCGARQNVNVSVGAWGDYIYECKGCGLTTYDEDEMNQHNCSSGTRLWRRVKLVAGSLLWP